MKMIGIHCVLEEIKMTLESIIQYSWRAVGRIYSGNHATLEHIFYIAIYSVYIGRIYFREVCLGS